MGGIPTHPPACEGAKPEQAGAPLSLREALPVWLRIGLLSFGGPAGQIALMHRILVEEKRWIDEARFLHALNYCMLLPGPEAQQLATYTGWLMHRVRGGLVAGLLFILPGALVMLALSVLYAAYRDVTLVGSLFFGIKAAVLAVVVEAVLRIGRRALKTRAALAIAVAAFVAIFFFAVPFPVIVVASAGLGYLCLRAPAETAAEVPMQARDPHALRSSLKVLATCLVLWLGPVIALASLLGLSNVYAQEGLFFSKMAVVTFGGAYAVLAYVAQQAVETHGWLAPGEMLDGLGMAETTPGPLIMVVQFVGFMGAYRNPGLLDPMLAGTLGAILTTWVTFVPCFLWIFLGAPFIERLRGNRTLSAALSGITAAVVGVVLNLALWFGLHVIFGEIGEHQVLGARLLVPVWGSVDPLALVLAVGAMLAMLRFKVGMIPTLAVCAAINAAGGLVGI